MNHNNLEQATQIGTVNRVLEFDVNTDSFLRCRWTNFGQKVFDKRLIVNENFDANDGQGGFVLSGDWPDWVKEIVPLSAPLRNIVRNLTIDDLDFVDAVYDENRNLLDDAHFRIELRHYLIYFVSSPGSPTGEHTVIVAGVWGGSGATQIYRCYDVKKCPLPDGESMRFTRDLPTEPADPPFGLPEPQFYQFMSNFIFPPFIDGYQVDIDPIV